MRYIVVYTIIILGLSALNAGAQKPNIDLLPTAGENMHPEALIDTSITTENLQRFDSLSIPRDTVPETSTELSYKEDAEPVEKKRSYGTNAGIMQGIKPLIYWKLNPFKIIFFFTALKF